MQLIPRNIYYNTAEQVRWWLWPTALWYITKVANLMTKVKQHWPTLYCFILTLSKNTCMHDSSTFIEVFTRLYYFLTPRLQTAGLFYCIQTYKILHRLVLECGGDSIPDRQKQQGYPIQDSFVYPVLTKSSATAKSTAHLSCLAGVLYDITQKKTCWWLIDHFYVTGHESYRIRQNGTK